jgi:hypothetical protein
VTKGIIFKNIGNLTNEINKGGIHYERQIEGIDPRVITPTGKEEGSYYTRSAILEAGLVQEGSERSGSDLREAIQIALERVKLKE